MAHPALRGAVERLLVRTGAAAVARKRTRGRTLILAYHNVVPDHLGPVGDRSLHLPLGAFRAQLDLLASLCDVVPLTALFDGTSASRPRVAITFDDACRGAVTLGVDELVRRGLPGTIFVAPGLLEDRSFWWDELYALGGEEGLLSNLRQRALTEWRGEGDVVRAGLRALGMDPRPDLLPAEARTATTAELAGAAGRGGITFGSHSWSHPNLAVLPPEAVALELSRSSTWLSERFPAVTIPWLAYPYGLEAAHVRVTAESQGFAAGLLVDGGWMARGRMPSFATPRSNVPAGISSQRFLLRLSDFPGL